MIAARMAGIGVFATGGIGGVHRGAAESFDISADLSELACTCVCVVSAGAKAILDLPKTLEMLETLGVPVIGYGTSEFPAFYSRSSGLPLSLRAETPAGGRRNPPRARGPGPAPGRPRGQPDPGGVGDPPPGHGRVHGSAPWPTWKPAG